MTVADPLTYTSFSIVISQRTEEKVETEIHSKHGGRNPFDLCFHFVLSIFIIQEDGLTYRDGSTDLSMLQTNYEGCTFCRVC